MPDKLSTSDTGPRQRLSRIRHDLRNPLGEIIGFTDVLIEEAREQELDALTVGLEQIRQTANRILADINHALNLDAIRSTPDWMPQLKETVKTLSDQILQRSQELSDQCDELGVAAFGDDLLRISGSARHLKEFAHTALEDLDAQPIAEEPPVVTGESNVSGTSRATQAEGPGITHPKAIAGAILIVDDQEGNRTLLSRRLRKQGHQVSLAADGRHALERLRARRFDLVLLDIVMPEMDGVEVLRQVKADPALQNIPVLMLSAVDELDAIVQCIELGAADYLPRPFPPAILQARIQSCLANKRMSDQLRKYTEWLFGKTLFSQALAAPGSLDLHRQERTVLFADIRGFTHWSECHTPEEAVAMLNQYFETAETIWSESSVIKTEYTGDEIMGVFPEAFDAVRIGHTLRVELGKLLRKFGLGLGVGIHTGLVTEGILGGAEVKAYAFVGDTVNTASRICAFAQASQVLLSESTFIQVAARVEAGSEFPLAAKGKAEPLKVRPLVEPVSKTG